MSQTDPTAENPEELLDEKSVSESYESYETEEEDISEKIATEITPKRKNEIINFKKKNTKLPSGRLTVSFRKRKFIRQTKTKKSPQKTERKKVKRSQVKKKTSEKRIEVPKLGKRCRVGGKAKVKPLASQENQDKNDSDDDSDSTYFSRISLGHFQQLKDKSGASTSYQSEEDKPHDLCLRQIAAQNENSEEEEFKELRMWGRNVLNTYFCILKNWGNYSKSLVQVNK